MSDRYINRAESDLGQYAQSLTLAREKFLSADFDEMAQRAGAKFTGACIESVFLGRTCIVSCSDAVMYYKGSDRPVSGTEQVIILQNLLYASGAPLTEKLVTLRELPKGGVSVYTTFKKRALDVLGEAFGKEPQKMLCAAEKLGGDPVKLADAAVKIHVLPRIPVIYSIWAADDEFPAEANILFDSSCTEYLPSVEDIAVAASFGVYAMADI